LELQSLCKNIYFLDNQYYFWKIKFIVGDRTERVIGRVKVEELIKRDARLNY
jgi:hypothetical protein